MIKDQQPSSIFEAPSLIDDAARRQQLMKQQGVKSTMTAPQRLIEAVAGGRQAGESTENARRRGVRRLGAGALTAAVVLAGPTVAQEAGHTLEAAHDRQQTGYLQPLKQYEKDGSVPKGMVAVQGGEDADPTQWVKDNGANLDDADATQQTIDMVQAQADSENYPGVQSNDVMVLPAAALNEQAQTLTIKVGK